MSPNTSEAAPRPLLKRLPLSPALVNSRCKMLVTSPTRTPPCNNFPDRSRSELPTAWLPLLTSSFKKVKDLPSASATAVYPPAPVVLGVVLVLVPAPNAPPPDEPLLLNPPPCLLHALRAS